MSVIQCTVCGAVFDIESTGAAAFAKGRCDGCIRKNDPDAQARFTLQEIEARLDILEQRMAKDPHPDTMRALGSCYDRLVAMIPTAAHSDAEASSPPRKTSSPDV